MMEEVSLEHSQSMTAAGIPKLYHGMTFDDMGEPGQALLTLYRDRLPISTIRKGKGAVFLGWREAFYVTARMLHLKYRMGATVISPSVLALWLKSDDSRMDGVLARPALFLKDFFWAERDTREIFTGFERHLVTTFITGRMEAGMPVFFDAEAPPAAWTWWPATLKRLAASSCIVVSP